MIGEVGCICKRKKERKERKERKEGRKERKEKKRKERKGKERKGKERKGRKEENVFNLSYSGKWFEPRSVSCLSCVIVRVRVVFRKTVGGD